MRKGIILAGGEGRRLYPCTSIISKQLLPIYDKPLIYYPLSTLMLADIKDILVITTQFSLQAFQALLKDGSQWGIRISYAVQFEPNGIAECFRIAKDFIGDDDVALILGDNIFYGNQLTDRIKQAANLNFAGCTLFAYHVADPERFGVLQFDENKEVIDIIEKPAVAPSNYAVTGLYLYDAKVVDYSFAIKPSARGELEITDINKMYLKNGDVSVEILNRGTAWMDAGTFASMAETSSFIGSVQRMTNTLIACPEEIAFQKSWIGVVELSEAAERNIRSDYGKYLTKLALGG